MGGGWVRGKVEGWRGEEEGEEGRERGGGACQNLTHLREGGGEGEGEGRLPESYSSNLTHVLV